MGHRSSSTVLRLGSNTLWRDNLYYRRSLMSVSEMLNQYFHELVMPIEEIRNPRPTAIYSHILLRFQGREMRIKVIVYDVPTETRRRRRRRSRWRKKRWTKKWKDKVKVNFKRSKVIKRREKKVNLNKLIRNRKISRFLKMMRQGGNKKIVKVRRKSIIRKIYKRKNFRAKYKIFVKRRLKGRLSFIFPNKSRLLYIRGRKVFKILNKKINRDKKRVYAYHRWLYEMYELERKREEERKKRMRRKTEEYDEEIEEKKRRKEEEKMRQEKLDKERAQERGEIEFVPYSNLEELKIKEFKIRKQLLKYNKTKCFLMLKYNFRKEARRKNRIKTLFHLRRGWALKFSCIRLLEALIEVDLYKNVLGYKVRVNFRLVGPSTVLPVDIFARFIAIKLSYKYSLGELIYPLMDGLRKIGGGVMFKCTGRFNRMQRAQKRVFRSGKVAPGMHGATLEYRFEKVVLKYGVGGIKFWLNRRGSLRSIKSWSRKKKKERLTAVPEIEGRSVNELIRGEGRYLRRKRIRNTIYNLILSKVKI